jgi:hypothetical protein
MENIKVKNAGYYGMSLIGSYCTYKNIYAVDNYRHGMHPGGSLANSNEYNTYKDIYCWNNGVSGFDDKGEDGSGNNLYDNIRAWNNGHAGISIIFQSSGTLINSLSYDNSSYYGINIRNIDNFTLENCITYSNFTDGIYIKDCGNIDLSNVISKNNSTSNTTNDSGIHIIDTPYIELSLCQSYDDRNPPLQDAGIITEGTTKYVKITNCKLTPNEKYTILNLSNAIIIFTRRSIRSR